MFAQAKPTNSSVSSARKSVVAILRMQRNQREKQGVEVADPNCKNAQSSRVQKRISICMKRCALGNNSTTQLFAGKTDRAEVSEEVVMEVVSEMKANYD